MVVRVEKETGMGRMRSLLCDVTGGDERIKDMLCYEEDNVACITALWWDREGEAGSQKTTRDRKSPAGIKTPGDTDEACDTYCRRAMAGLRVAPRTVASGGGMHSSCRVEDVSNGSRYRRRGCV
jgi:hypothetical protein